MRICISLCVSRGHMMPGWPIMITHEGECIETPVGAATARPR
jgi:hypothetical protein